MVRAVAHTLLEEIVVYEKVGTAEAEHVTGAFHETAKLEKVLPMPLRAALVLRELYCDELCQYCSVYRGS
eukprot:3404422-Rhodomonas_salina.5